MGSIVETGFSISEASRGPTQTLRLLTFLVLGDFGTGSKKQFRLAETMSRVVDERERAGSPVRFELTTGDNFYDFFLFFSTGSDDEQFYKKFFVPYQSLLTRIPFFPSHGNHDGSESESTHRPLSLSTTTFFFRRRFFRTAHCRGSRIDSIPCALAKTSSC